VQTIVEQRKAMGNKALLSRETKGALLARWSSDLESRPFVHFVEYRVQPVGSIKGARNEWHVRKCNTLVHKEISEVI